jgi:hypothetical protein
MLAIDGAIGRRSSRRPESHSAKLDASISPKVTSSIRILMGVLRLTVTSAASKAHQKSGPFPPPALPGYVATMTLSDSGAGPPRQCTALRPRPSPDAGLPRYPVHLSGVPFPLSRRIEWVHMSIASPSVQPSPLLRRVSIRIITFEACSGFTHITAHRIARPPKAAFVTRLRPHQLPGRTARQLPDLSTTIRVDPSSTGEPRPRGALNYIRRARVFSPGI